ncbi:MAG: glycosyltransferase [Flavobacteriaceae bacterium]
MHYRRLTIVSDTALYKKDNQHYGFGPVVRELEEIQGNFDEIIWIGFLRNDKIDDLSMQIITSSIIKPIYLKSVGGKNLWSFLNILLNYPIMLYTITKYILKADIIHTRAPSHPALIGGLLSFLFKNKIWWNKFAGNWAQVNPPKSYGFQRWLFKNAKHTNVTINGFWQDQPKHCHSFENPCLTNEDIKKGSEITANKNFEAPFVFSFVGRLEDAKGVSRIIESLKNIPQEKIKEVHFVGDGNKTQQYIQEASFLGNKVFFHGFLGKNEVHSILAESHFFLLPSTASEGFPKVIAEAACYGTIPIVSNVSSIGHYINDSNGFLWNIEGQESFDKVFSSVINTNSEQLKSKSTNIPAVAKMFTFDNYKSKLEKFVFKPR